VQFVPFQARHDDSIAAFYQQVSDLPPHVPETDYNISAPVAAVAGPDLFPGRYACKTPQARDRSRLSTLANRQR
jgi:hypothetical protein